MMLIIPIHEHSICFHLFVSSQCLSSASCNFSSTGLLHPWLIFSRYFILFEAIWALGIYSPGALFVVLHLVPLRVRLDCLFEVFPISWCRPVRLWISLLGLFSLCPIDFGLLCSHFHLIQVIFLFLPWCNCSPIYCLVIFYLASMSSFVFQDFFSSDRFLVSIPSWSKKVLGI